MTTTETETQLERTIREEQEAHDAEQESQESQESQKPVPEGRIFDASDYEREDLALPKIDGNGIDKIAINFTGRVFLDRADPHDVALIRRLMLGHNVTLQVEGVGKTFKGGFTTNKDGDLDVIVLERSVKVHTVYRPAAEEL